MMARATIAGLDYESPVTEFNVRPQAGTAPSVVLFKARKGTANLDILDVQPDNQGTRRTDGQVYQWFKLRFPDGQDGWLRGHVLKIDGDLTQFGYGTLRTAEYAYRLTRVMPTAAPTPTTSTPTTASEVTTTPTTSTPSAATEVTTAAPEPTPSTPTTTSEVTSPEPVTAPTPVTPAPAPETTTTDESQCAATVIVGAGARLRQSPVLGDPITVIPHEAIAEVLEIQTVSGQQHRWLRVRYEEHEGWTREDLLSYSGDCARFNLRVTSSSPARAVEYEDYSDGALYPVPMARYRFVRGFTGHQPSHPGVDYGGDEGEPMLAGPVGGLVVASVECVKCNVPGKPSTQLQGLGLANSAVFSDPDWNFGFGHYIIVRYLNNQLPAATQAELTRRGMPGWHIYSMYAHLSRRAVETGATLAANQVFAACGNSGNSSGSHLHLELRADRSSSFPGWARIGNGLVDPLIMFER